jgi:hypothetical protein
MTNVSSDDRHGLLPALIDDGRPLLKLTALCLIGSGLFALFLSATRHFLPHDVAYLGMTPPDLCAINECRIVHFMLHDRVSFGGAIIAVGTLYLYLTEFPLRQRQAWAWWLLALSGVVGFGSFLLYLGYGYLDSWHGVATLFLLPCYITGLAMTYRTLTPPISVSSLLVGSEPLHWKSFYDLGRLCLLATGLALALGGAIISGVGVTTVFVPQDLQYMGLTTERLQAINPRLLPLIAHDRAGFGGGVCCCGVTMFFCVWCGQMSRALWQALLIMGIAGFGTAIGIHPLIGYTDAVHLSPAVAGAAMFAAGMAVTCRRPIAHGR